METGTFFVIQDKCLAFIESRLTQPFSAPARGGRRLPLSFPWQRRRHRGKDTDGTKSAVPFHIQTTKEI
jgi:hypothetical protein